MLQYFSSLSSKTLSTAAVEKVHKGFAIYPELLNSAGVEKLLKEARNKKTWNPIFNPDNNRRVGTAGSFGQNVALEMHRFLTEDACILDAHAHTVDLIQHKDKTASFLWSLPGCREQPPHADFRPWGCKYQNSRLKPISCIVFLKKATDSSGSRIKIWMIDAAGNTIFEIVKGNAGDLLVFEGEFL
jgi:hypothetical protein